MVNVSQAAEAVGESAGPTIIARGSGTPQVVSESAAPSIAATVSASTQAANESAAPTSVANAYDTIYAIAVTEACALLRNVSDLLLDSLLVFNSAIGILRATG